MAEDFEDIRSENAFSFSAESSPGTQTLNHLSQSMSSQLLDLSRVETSVVDSLRQMKNQPPPESPLRDKFLTSNSRSGRRVPPSSVKSRKTPPVKKGSTTRRRGHPSSKTVVQVHPRSLKAIQSFPSMRAAGRQVGAEHRYISRAVKARTRQNPTAGYLWCLQSDYGAFCKAWKKESTVRGCKRKALEAPPTPESDQNETSSLASPAQSLLSFKRRHINEQQESIESYSGVQRTTPSLAIPASAPPVFRPPQLEFAINSTNSKSPLPVAPTSDKAPRASTVKSATAPGEPLLHTPTGTATGHTATSHQDTSPTSTKPVAPGLCGTPSDALAPTNATVPKAPLSTSTSGHKPEDHDSYPMSFGPFEVHRVLIDFEGPIGLTVLSASPPKSALEALQTGVPREQANHCCRVRLVEDKVSPLRSVMGRAGDEYVLERRAPGRFTFCDYDAVRRMAKEEKRPFCMYFLRAKQSDILDVVAMAERGVLLCCKKCRDNLTTHGSKHHSWCPRRLHFETSGAKDVFDRIIKGVKKGCPACLHQFRSGKVDKKIMHASSCEAFVDPTAVKPKSSTMKESQPNMPITTWAKDRSAVSGAAAPSSKSRFSLAEAVSGKVSTTLRPKVVKMGELGDSKTSVSKGTPPCGDPTVSTKAKAPADHKPNVKPQSDATSPTMKPPAGMSIAQLSTKPPAGSSQPSKADDPAQADEASAVDDDAAHEWRPCENPWGSEAIQFDDFVILTPEPGIGRHLVQGTNERFVENPFDNEKYRLTHKTFEEGHEMIVLRRGPSNALSWGFTCFRHEFGGACLVESVEPLSPAATACRVGTYASTEDSKLGLQDMILAVNGKSVGSMTTVDLDIELATSGFELSLYVARYKPTSIAKRAQLEEEAKLFATVDAAIHDKARLDWTDVGDSLTSPDMKYVAQTAVTPWSPGKNLPSPAVAALPRSHSTSDLRAPADYDCLPGSPLIDPVPEIEIFATSTGCIEKPNADEISSKSPSERSQPPAVAGKVPSDILAKNSDPDENEDDGNAWYGCVCEKIHPVRDPVFWIQCEGCQSWYNVYHGCIGFSESQAQVLAWNCPFCCSSSHGKSETQEYEWTGQLSGFHAPEDDDDATMAVVPVAKVPRRPTTASTLKNPVDQAHAVVFQPGQLVYVQKHSWPGVDNPEGAARVLQEYKDDDSNQMYDVKYVVERTTARGILAQFIAKHEASWIDNMKAD